MGPGLGECARLVLLGEIDNITIAAVHTLDSGDSTYTFYLLVCHAGCRQSAGNQHNFMQMKEESTHVRNFVEFGPHLKVPVRLINEMSE